MVSLDELKDDEEFSDLKEDVEEECKRFGKVVDMVIPRPQVYYCVLAIAIVLLLSLITDLHSCCMFRRASLFRALETSTCALTRNLKLHMP